MSARAPHPVVRLLAPVAMMAAIFYFSAQPFDGQELAWWEVLGRKLGHVAGYAILTAAWFWALAGRVRRPLAVAAVLSLAYAASDEYHQTFVDGRTGTPVDVGVDAIGIAISYALIRSRKAKSNPAARREGSKLRSSPAR
jgi:VanZ family protein